MCIISPEAALDPLLQQSLPKPPGPRQPLIYFLTIKPFFVQPASLCKCLTGSLVPTALTATFPVSSHLRGASQSSSPAPVSISHHGFCNSTPRLTHKTFSRPRLQAPALSSHRTPRRGTRRNVALEIKCCHPPHRESHNSGVSRDYH